MSKKSSSSSSTGVGFFGLLTVAFIILKLTKVIDWSWFWVLAPTWGSCTIGLFCIGVLALFAWVQS